ncbi:retrotransposable element [Pimephales promelas]|nr:retrotransposable element [Pimephales promelas]
MEQSIGELERAIHENSIMLERLTSKTPRRSRAPHQPDGASIHRAMYHSPGPRQNELPVVSPTLQISGQPGALTRSPAKLPRYSGLTPLEPYLAQVDLAALHDGWSCEETAIHLALALEGPALQVLIDLSPEERRDLQALTAALNRRFGQRTSAEQSREELANRRRCEGESVGAFAADIRVYTRKGYPTFQAAAREELSLHAFLRGLTPERLRQHVRLLSPRNLSEALREAERAEEVLQARPATGRSSLQHHLTRAVEREVDVARSEEEGLPCSEPPAPGNVTPGKRPRSEAVRGPSPRSSVPLHNDCPTVGRCGSARGLYLDCVVDGQPCSALVDTGSTICLLRKGLLSGTAGPLPEDWTPTSTELLTVTGERTVMPGKKLLSVVVGMSQTNHEFWLADIRDECIIGLDLLSHWGARVDVPGAALCLDNETVPLRLGRSHHGKAPTPKRHTRAAETQGETRGGIGAQTNTSPPLTPHAQSAPPSPETVVAVEELGRRSSEHLSTPQQEQLQRLLGEFMDIFAAREEDCTRTALVQHHIDTGPAAPIRLRPHRLPLAKRQAAEEMIREMAANGIIEPSDSPWAAPMVMVRKKTGAWRPCVDFRRLNAVTRKDSYPLPRIDDALDYVAGSCWFSSLDLRSGYWQVELAAEARPKTAFTIGQGLWQFKVMPFGLCNAPATFERLMERVLKDIPRTRCVVYLDDLLVHARDFDQAVHNLREVLTAIRSAGLRLNPAKCNLLTRQTQFLGHVVSESGVATDPTKVAAVRDWPPPTNITELRSFLGLASYYRRFVRDFATIASPLHQLTNKGRRFGWSEDCAVAFRQLKAALIDAPVLAYPDPNQPFLVDTDASNVGVGAVLSQRGENGERVVAYYSCSLSRPERNYCVTRRELLAVVLAVRHFRPYLLGTRFTLRTDHASLTWMLNFRQPEGQVARWLEILQDRQEERCLEPSSAAVRPGDTRGDGEPFTTEQLRQQQANDQAVAGAGWGIDRLQLLVPHALRPEVLRWVHGAAGAGHFGNSKTVRRLRQRFYWPGCRQDTEMYVHCCDICTAQKGPSQRSHAPLQQYLVGAPMERIGVDILGPFPITDAGNRFVLVAMDYFTKWPEAYAVPDQSASTTAQRLVDEMFARFGVPDELHSDQGRNFESRLFSEVCQRLGVKKTRTTPLHPQSDGLVERFNRTLATQLAILTSQHQRDWDQHLPLVLWAYRTAVQESSQCTPAALMFGRELRTPVDLVFGSPPEPDITGGPELDYFRKLKERLSTVHQMAREALRDAGARQKRAYDARAHGPTIGPGDKVWVFCPQFGLSPKLTHHWQGPGEVLDKISEVVFRVRMPGRGRRVVLHKDRLAPYHPLAPEQKIDEGHSHSPKSPPSAETDNDGLKAEPGVSQGRLKRVRRRPGHLLDFVVGD